MTEIIITVAVMVSILATYAIKKYKDMAGIKNDNITLHSLRHSLASISVINNESIYDIKEALGHENIGTTEHYIHNTNELKNPISENMEKTLGI